MEVLVLLRYVLLIVYACLPVCVCVCVYIHTHTHTHIYLRIFFFVYVYVKSNICTDLDRPLGLQEIKAAMSV